MQQTLHAISRPPPTKVFTFDGLLRTFASVPLVPELLCTFASVPLVPELLRTFASVPLVPELLCTFASVPLVPELLRTFASVPLVPEPPHEVSAVITPRHAHVAEQLEREGGREGFRYSDIQLKLSWHVFVIVILPITGHIV